jgi:CPA1 family monovalent cation:H+ antiporter
VLIGGAIGTAAVMLMPFLHRLPAAAMSVAVAYGSFVLADGIL